MKCYDVYSQKVALWGQISALSSPLPLLPCSLVCFLEKWRVGEREERGNRRIGEREEGRNGTRGKEGKHHAHSSTNPVQYNTSAIVTCRKPFLHHFTPKLLIMYTVPFFSSSAFAWAFNRAFLCLRCLFFSSDAERLPAGEVVASCAFNKHFSSWISPELVNYIIYLSWSTVDQEIFTLKCSWC